MCWLVESSAQTHLSFAVLPHLTCLCLLCNERPTLRVFLDMRVFWTVVASSNREPLCLTPQVTPTEEGAAGGSEREGGRWVEVELVPTPTSQNLWERPVSGRELFSLKAVLRVPLTCVLTSALWV